MGEVDDDARAGVEHLHAARHRGVDPFGQGARELVGSVSGRHGHDGRERGVGDVELPRKGGARCQPAPVGRFEDEARPAPVNGLPSHDAVGQIRQIGADGEGGDLPFEPRRAFREEAAAVFAVD